MRRSVSLRRIFWCGAILCGMALFLPGRSWGQWQSANANVVFNSQYQPPASSDWQGPLPSPTNLPYQDRAKEPWRWQLLPDGIIYHSYLAGVQESRFASNMFYDDDLGWLWDVSLGGRVAVVRYGSEGAFHPEGFQLDIEGAGFPRLALQDARELVSTDFRFGVPLTYGVGPFQFKLAYYHLSSHLGDEYQLLNPGVERVNYVRDAFVLGGSLFATDDIRLYAEVGAAFFTSGGADPFEFQFGAEYSPAPSTDIRGAPFAAINGHLREEVNFGGSLVVQAGWQWRGRNSDRLWRIGGQYLNGQSPQMQFYDTTEQQLGFGVWFDY